MAAGILSASPGFKADPEHLIRPRPLYWHDCERCLRCLAESEAVVVCRSLLVNSRVAIEIKKILRVGVWPARSLLEQQLSENPLFRGCRTQLELRVFAPRRNSVGR